MLADPEQTGVVAVAPPEEMPVNETLALRDALRRRLGLTRPRSSLNGVLPIASAPTRRPPSRRSAPRRGAPVGRRAAGRRARAPARAARAAAARRLEATPVELPFVFAAELDAAELARLARTPAPERRAGSRASAS